MIRKGLGKGQGSGYKNILLAHDRKVHHDAGCGRKQPQRMPQLKGGYDMRPSYDSRKSFYGKADIRVEGNKKILKSYSTDVAYIDLDTGKAVVNGMYSQTTLRHIKEFLKQNGLKADSWKQIEKDYSPTKEDIAKQEREDYEKFESMNKSIAMVAKLGDIFGKDEKEKNDWKARMLKAGLESKGLLMPDDWDTLSEETKKARLDAVIAQMSKKGGKIGDADWYLKHKIKSFFSFDKKYRDLANQALKAQDRYDELDMEAYRYADAIERAIYTRDKTKEIKLKKELDDLQKQKRRVSIQAKKLGKQLENLETKKGGKLTDIETIMPFKRDDGEDYSLVIPKNIYKTQDQNDIDKWAKKVEKNLSEKYGSDWKADKFNTKTIGKTSMGGKMNKYSVEAVDDELDKSTLKFDSKKTIPQIKKILQNKYGYNLEYYEIKKVKGGKRIRSGSFNGKPLFHQGDRIQKGNWSDKRWKKSTTKDNKQVGKKYETWEKSKYQRWK